MMKRSNGKRNGKRILPTTVTSLPIFLAGARIPSTVDSKTVRSEGHGGGALVGFQWWRVVFERYSRVMKRV